jgi:hypothetical protein
LAATVLALAASELLLRAFAPLHLAGIQQAYIYDSELGIRLRPGLEATHLTDHLEEIHTNPLGTVNFQPDFSGYQTLVFALGDSYTQGTGLPSDAAYPFQLDLLLNTDGSGAYAKNFAVVNLGLAAYGPEQSLITLRRYAGKLGAPKYCLYLGSENDYYDDLLFRGGYRHDSLVEGSPRWGWMTGPLLWASRFEVFKRAKLAVSQFRRGRVSDASSPPATGDTTNPPSVAELTWPVIDQIRIACESNGGRFIASWSSMESPSYEWLKTRSSEAGFAFAHWKPRVESVRESIPQAPLMNPHSGGHLRGWVNGGIAAAFAREIRRLEAPSEPAAATP